jgi:preprotein translocase subunit SecA
MEKAELACYQDPQKKQLYAYREELYFHMDERNHEADISEMGRTFMDPENPDAFVLPDIGTEFAEIDHNNKLDLEAKAKAKIGVQEHMDAQAQKLHSISQLLRAYTLYEKDVSYVVEAGKVMIVDENTGRKMPGRRWSEGLHQAVEAKERVKIEPETQTLATITIQNYFRLYRKLAGMTGTAETEAAEFSDIYKLDLLIIPTNRKVTRTDFNDKIFKTQREKYNAVIAIIKERHEKGQPILVGTSSVIASETVSRLLQREKVTHQVLNARFHMQEAEIVAKAGQRGAVTVSTNMAGRGTDIKLGAGVADLGGLLVIGTERFESRRVDRQLRGRCARQGDPGESIFFLSFEDQLMLNFGGAERMTKLMERMGMEDGQELEHPWLNKSIESAQKRVEQRNYIQRKHTLEYDDVMNKQRQVIYNRRNEILNTDKPTELVNEAISDGFTSKIDDFTNVESGDVSREDVVGWTNVSFFPMLKLEHLPENTKDVGGIATAAANRVKDVYAKKVAIEDPNIVHEVERQIMLHNLDSRWRDHLYAMDSLRDNTRFQHVAQKDPLVEYKKSAFDKFRELVMNIDGDIMTGVFQPNRYTNHDGYLKVMREAMEEAGIDFDKFMQENAEAAREAMAEQQAQAQEAQRRQMQQQQLAAQQAAAARPSPSIGGGSQSMTFGGGGGMGGGSFTMGSGGMSLRPAPPQKASDES